jgi:hypothetical protein
VPGAPAPAPAPAPQPQSSQPQPKFLDSGFPGLFRRRGRDPGQAPGRELNARWYWRNRRAWRDRPPGR